MQWLQPEPPESFQRRIWVNNNLIKITILRGGLQSTRGGSQEGPLKNMSKIQIKCLKYRSNKLSYKNLRLQLKFRTTVELRLKIQYY